MFAKIDKTGAPIDRGWAWMIVVGMCGREQLTLCRRQA